MHTPGTRRTGIPAGTSGPAAASNALEAEGASDGVLVSQTLAGQPEAFGHLVLRYQDRLYNALAYQLGSPEDARDVVQEALVQAFVKLSGFQQASAFYTWLYRIGFNLAVSRQRRRRPTTSLDALRESAGQEPISTSEPPERRLMQGERVALVQQALSELDEDHRVVLVLREMEECSYEQMAEMLSLPVGTIRSRLFRARMALRELLQGQDET